MSMNNARPGIGSVPEYQVSGVPWALSGSVSTAQEFDFPMVSRAITVANNSAAGTFLLVGFTQNGVNGSNCFPLDGGKTQRFEVRCRDLWLRGQGGATVNFGVLAELTAIERKQMPYLTGSLSPSDQVASSSWVYPGVG